MTDPMRWSDAGDGSTELEQTLVRSGQELPMPTAQKQAVWGRLLSALPPTTALPVVAGTSSLLGLPVVKALCLVVALSAVVAGSYHFLARGRSTAPVEHLPIVASVSTAPAIESPAALPESTVAAEASATLPVANQASPPSRASLLREESLAVIAARQALRENDAGGALRLLEQAQRRFKKGALLEEREALTIQALAKSGNEAQAARRAKAFMTNYPRSPHAADVQRYLAE
jgi:hypothetical protein